MGKETNKYKPELGQAVWGNPCSKFECPDFIEAGLRYLSDEIERVEQNRTQEGYESPIHNNGETYKTKVFVMRAYYWGDNEKCHLPNFKCGDFEVRWYKYLGRGMSINKKIDANRFFKIMDKCLKSVRKYD